MTRITRRSNDKEQRRGESCYLVGLVTIWITAASVWMYCWSAGRALRPIYVYGAAEQQPAVLRTYMEAVAPEKTLETDAKQKTPLFDSSFAKYLVGGLSKYIDTYDGGRPYLYRDSTFPHRFNTTLPPWFRKVFPLNRHITPDKQTCFVHVGKAGGSTIGCMLGFLIHCGEDKKTNYQTVPSLLSGTSAHSFHRGVYDCSDEAANYLFVIRDPLKRALSAFNYAKPDLTEKRPFSSAFKDKEIFVDCNFWTLNDLAERGLVKGSDGASMICKDRAKQALLGTEPYVVHWYYNYQYYYEAVPSDANIVVIRNEHIVDDWNSVETMLGGSADLKKESLPINNSYEKKPEEMYLSDAAKVALCETLCNDIQVYKIILKRARNIKKEQYNQSMQELIAVCPKEAVEESCIDAQPDIQEKVKHVKSELIY